MLADVKAHDTQAHSFCKLQHLVNTLKSGPHLWIDIPATADEVSQVFRTIPRERWSQSFHNSGMKSHPRMIPKIILIWFLTSENLTGCYSKAPDIDHRRQFWVFSICLVTEGLRRSVIRSALVWG